MGKLHDANLSGQDTLEGFIKEFPNREQVAMMTKWLEGNEPGTFTFTGLVDPSDPTVVTPQATVDYGYSWFSLSDTPAIVHTPRYDKFFSVSVFDMLHNVPGVITNPTRPTGGTAATTRRTSGPAAGRVVGSGFEQCDLEVVGQDDGACQELLLLGGEEPDVSSEQAHGDGYDVVQGDHSVVFESVPRPDRDFSTESLGGRHALVLDLDQR